MADLIGAENIDWDNFQVTDPDAPEYTAPTAEATVAPPAPVEADGHGGDIEPPAPEDTAPEQDGRPRDPETGQFLSAEEAERRQAAQGEEDPLLSEYLAKYGGDAAAALRAAAHQTDVIGRQGQEVGELRQQMAELLEAVNRPAPPPQAPARDYDTLFAENPALAVEEAIRVQDAYGVERILREWEEIDPAQVVVYKMAKQAQIENQQLRAEQQAMREQQGEQAYGNVMETAWQRLSREIPNLENLRSAMKEEAAEASRMAGGKPVYSELINSGDPDQTYYAFRTLALAAMHRDGAHQQQRVTDLARTQAVESQRAKAEAIVTSSTSTAPEPAEPQSYDEQFLDAMVAEDKPRSDGWQISGH